jgi:hypothetical protein
MSFIVDQFVSQGLNIVEPGLIMIVASVLAMEDNFEGVEGVSSSLLTY